MKVFHVFPSPNMVAVASSNKTAGEQGRHLDSRSHVHLKPRDIGLTRSSPLLSLLPPPRVRAQGSAFCHSYFIKKKEDIPGVPSRRTLASQPQLEWLCLQCNLTKELINKQSTSAYLAILVLQAGGTAEERARLSCSGGGDGDAEDCSGRGVVSFRCSGQDPGSVTSG